MLTKHCILLQRTPCLRLLLILLMPWIVRPAFGQAVNTWVQDVVLPPPNAAAMAKYGDIPVDLVSGLPNISIPIFTLEEGSLSLPVSLSYHASGLRVAEMASWVGMGWNLSAHGMISRTVLGTPDEANGYWFNGDDVENNFEDRQYLKDISTGVEDGEADMFSFNVPGLSGKFFFDKNHDYYVIPQNLDVKIETEFDITQSGFVSFTIIGPDGVRYIFGKDGTETAYEYLQAGLSAGNWRSSWMLLKMESSDQLYSITFDYTDENYQYKNLASCQYSEGSTTTGGGVSCGGNGEDIAKHRYVLHTTSGKKLTSIQGSSSGYSIDFAANTLREDLPAKRLDHIQISSNDNIACTRFDFSYTYFDDGQTVYNGPNAPLPYFKRLKLDQVQEFSCNSSLSKGPYTFTYAGPLNTDGTNYLPHRLSKAIDHWGYYNGKHDNEILEANIPETNLTHPIGGIPITYGSADRETDPAFMGYGSLTEIQYPTGGRTLFTMEANTIPKWQGTGPVYLVQDLTTCAIPSSSCCGSIPNQAIVSFSNTNEIDNAFFDLKVFNLNSNFSCSGSSSSGKIELFQGSTFLGSFPLTLGANGNTLEEKQKPLNDILNAGVQLVPNTSYTCIITSVNSQTNFSLYHESMQQIPYPVGGLRLAEVRSDDNIPATPDVVKQYLYEEQGPNNLTAGHLLFQPTYGITGSFYCTATQYYAIYSTTPPVPMSNYEGRHVVYPKVTEVLPGSGKTVYQYQLNIAPDIFPILGPGSGFWGTTLFEAPPQLYKNNHGNLFTKKVLDESGQEVSLETNNPFFLSYTEPPGSMIKVKWLYDEGHECQFYGFFFYRPRTSAYLMASQEISIDGVNTVTDYGYDPELDHHQPISVSTTNSDGRVQEQRLKFPDAYDPNTVVDIFSSLTAQDLLDLNLISSPIESQTWQGQSGNLEMIGGQLNQYVNLGNSVQKKVRLHDMYGFETTTPVSQANLAEQTNSNGQYTSLFPNSSYYQKRVEFDYDYSSGRLSSQALTGGSSSSYIWGYSDLRPTAEVSNASSENIAYTSFEETDNLQEGNWTLDGQAGGYQLFNSKTGWQGFNLSPNRTATANGLGAGSYTLSFWLQGNDDMVFFTNGTILPSPNPKRQSDADQNGWVYYEYEINLSSTNNTVMISSNDAATVIDELRLYPSQAHMTTYCYDKALRIHTVTDANNQSLYYTYDGLGRLINVKDFEGNIINQTEYHYYTE
ncbi:MAG: RHS repeat domain-containing protein [Bacteroidota bacterium]